MTVCSVLQEYVAIAARVSRQLRSSFHHIQKWLALHHRCRPAVPYTSSTWPRAMKWLRRLNAMHAQETAMQGIKGLPQLRSGSGKFQPPSQNGADTSPGRGPPSMHDSQMSMPVSSAENSIQVSFTQFPCLCWVANINVSTQLCSTAKA